VSKGRGCVWWTEIDAHLEEDEALAEQYEREHRGR
jgi:hypothetical protein